ncbi:hypothetical protein CXF68_14335 [Tenacibaculum sp. Bg11-29]|uniref:DUF7151 family protein n=1 Tax=Tenacibaculum sp. Bg11-29 TaxID=2058306 RepID=UPI000C330C95|nr:hypothetical protein [Tenacibaculum sp. Bg11-29]PKH51790.1 hypothetical protein CXF68_14335 [Tenacibaculum sp. Bg11-29]
MKNIKLNNFRHLTLLLILLSACQENGYDGLANLTNIISEAPGINCERGGLKIETGLDINSNGILDKDEVDSNEFVCNGLNGLSYLSSYITEPKGINCEKGGIKVSFGLDSNNNGTLDDIEITSSTFLCNGVDANDLLTEISSILPGNNCDTGGTKIEYGLDVNGNGSLEKSEVSSTAYFCNGEEGKTSLIRIIEDKEGVCEKGGLIIVSGRDSNSDGNLSEEEIIETRSICNGVDGKINEEIRLVLHTNFSGATGVSGTGVNSYPALINFDKRNWSKAYSIYFSTYLKTDDSLNNAILDLYNMTFYQTIGSVSTNSTEFTNVVSDNIIDHLPEANINLYLYLRSSNVTDSVVWIRGKSELIIKQEY